MLARTGERGVRPRKEVVEVPGPYRPNPDLLRRVLGEEPPFSQPCAASAVPLFLSASLVSLARDRASRAWLFQV